MLTLYHDPISPNSRRVWLTLLEKGLEFDLVEVNLGGEQFSPEFLEISPFHHVPTLTDNGFNLIESLAILDYLEAKYPTPRMLPDNPKDLSIMRMVQFVTVNELLPATSPLLFIMIGFLAGDPAAMDQSKQKIFAVLSFFERLLDDRPFFGSETITLAEPVAGTVIPWMPSIGISMDDFPKVKAWCDRIQARPAWQKAQITPEMLEAFKVKMIARFASSAPT